MIFAAEIALIGINILMAWWHSKLITTGKPIKHGIWGFGYLIFSGLLSFALGSWVLFISSLFIRKVVFDLSLNVFRFGWGELFYITPEVKNVTGLWDAIRKGKTIDWIHYKMWGNYCEVYYIVYFLITIILTIWLLR